MHGWRPRVDLLVPSINTIMEPEFYRTAPEVVTVHTARMVTPREGSRETLRDMPPLPAEPESAGVAAE